MNYLELINAFWQLDREHPFTAIDTRLYFYLVHTCNTLRWKNPFGHSDRHLAVALGSSVNTVREAKKRLQQRGLIDFTTPPVRSRSFEGQTLYTIKVQTVSKSDTVRNQTVSKSDTVPDTVGDTVPDTNSKPNETKPNQTKQTHTHTNEGACVIEGKTEAPKVFVPPTLEQAKEFAKAYGYGEEVGERAWHYYQSSDWHDRDGKKVTNWKQKFIGSWFKEKEQAEKNKDKTYKIPLQPFSDHNLNKEWQSWVKHRKQMGKPLTLESANHQIEYLNGFYAESAIEIIDHSITSGYTGLVEP